MQDRYLVDVNYEQLLSVRKEVARGCPDCETAFQGLCDKHLIYYSEVIKFIECNIPYHYIQSFIEDELVEKKCREYCLDTGKYLAPFNCYEGLINSYIKSLDTSVMKYGYSFFFYGFNGSGKTHTALYTLFRAIEKGLSGYYISFKDLINLYNKSEFMNEKDCSKLYRYIINCDVLVVDEIGKESSVTDNLVGSFEHIIKYRTSMPKPTILISNLDFSSQESGFYSRYGSSVHNAVLEHYRPIMFSKDGDFRIKMRKKWDL